MNPPMEQLPVYVYIYSLFASSPGVAHKTAADLQISLAILSKSLIFYDYQLSSLYVQLIQSQ